MTPVKVWQERVEIPTYETGPQDIHPMFLENRVYQGSSGAVYPYGVTDTLSEQKTLKSWQTVWLGNISSAPGLAQASKSTFLHTASSFTLNPMSPTEGYGNQNNDNVPHREIRIPLSGNRAQGVICLPLPAQPHTQKLEHIPT